MELLTTVTLVYAAVLVIALAVSLIAILTYLWRIGTVLAEVGDLLEETDRKTAALVEPLNALEEVTEHANRVLKAGVLDLAEAGDETGILTREPAGERWGVGSGE